MRVSKEKAAENRQALLQAASLLFREKGVDGVGVAEVAKQARLTHGAIYAHFDSKDALAAEAFSQGFAGSMRSLRAWKGDREPSFEEYLALLLSKTVRDRMAGCPMTASASDTARQGPALSASFTKAFEAEVALFEGTLEKTVAGAQRRRFAVTSVAAQIGAIAVARAIARTDPDLSDEVLDSVLDTMIAAHRSESSPG